MPVPVELAADEECGARPFAAPAHTHRDARVMQTMLERLRALAPGWRSGCDGFLLHEPDREGNRHWIRVPDCEALRAARRPTVVGFFGRARGDVDQTPIHELEAGIVDTLESIPGVLSYYDVGLAERGYGNLILCATPETPGRVHAHALHQRAVVLTPGHYHSVRLHTGFVPGPFDGVERLVIERTRYYDFDTEPAWVAVRRLA